MRTFFFLILLTGVSLLARDNPFFPMDPDAKDLVTSNHVENLPLFTKQQMSLPNSARAIKAITISYQNLDGSIEKENLFLNNKIDWHEPFIISQNNIKNTQQKYKKSTGAINAKFIKFVPSNKSMKIITKDKMLRNFMLTSPHRIVLDFSKEVSFRPKNFEIKKAPFTKIRMAKHKNYYRVVIELDGQYQYKVQTTSQEITVVCY